MMKALLLIGLAIVLLTLAASLYVRLAPVDAAEWHVDPATAELPATERYYVVRGDDALRFAVPAATLATALNTAALAEPRGRLIAGDLQGGWATYEHRTLVMGFPDYLSMKIEPTGAETSQLVVLSRARFGRRDFGVNEARVRRILHDMEHALGLDHGHAGEAPA